VAEKKLTCFEIKLKYDGTSSNHPAKEKLNDRRKTQFD